MNKVLRVIFILVLNSCRFQGANSLKWSDEKQILNLTFGKYFESDSAFRIAFRNMQLPRVEKPFSHEFDSAEYKRIKRRHDSAVKVIDTGKMYIVIYSKNCSLVHVWIEAIKDSIKESKMDTSFSGILSTLCIQNEIENKMSFSEIEPKYNYEFYDEDEDLNDLLLRRGSICFSKVAFNNEKDKACVFAEYRCGEFCGRGEIHFFKKRDNTWIYMKKMVLW
jgi:hypothetical protein